MLARLCLAICLYFALFATIASAQTVTLRPRIEANGPAITLGDVFEGAGPVAGRAIAPSPPPGQISTLSVPLLNAAASAAGLDWTPPPGVTEVRIVRPGGARATLPAADGARLAGDAVIRRGEAVILIYQTPGMSLTVRTRALEDGAVGQPIRLMNTTSQRTVDAIVTGPGQANATP